MKLAVLSDTHFGFAAGSEREEDSYEAAKEALEKATAADMILVSGDIFDLKVPNTETLARAMQVFTKPILSKSGVELLDTVNKGREEISPKSLMGTPVVAIHGTHERRIKGLMNPVQALEKAGFLIHLHCNGVVFQKGAEKVCIQGISGVPDQYTENVLQEWSPKPEPGCFNVFLIHQNIREFMHEKVPNTTPMESLPRGFDLYVLGHIHKPEKSKYMGKPVIVAGSLMETQINKDSVDEKGFWFFDTKTSETKFVRLEKQRHAYYLDMEKKPILDTEKAISELLKKQQPRKPVIRVKTALDYADINELKRKFEDRALLLFARESEKVEMEVKTLEEHKLSVQETGKKLLQENMAKFSLDVRVFEDVFELLLEKKPEEALALLLKAAEKALSKPSGSGLEEERLDELAEQAGSLEAVPEEKQPAERPEPKGKGLGRFLS